MTGDTKAVREQESSPRSSLVYLNDSLRSLMRCYVSMSWNMIVNDELPIWPFPGIRESIDDLERCHSH